MLRSRASLFALLVVTGCNAPPGSVSDGGTHFPWEDAAPGIDASGAGSGGASGTGGGAAGAGGGAAGAGGGAPQPYSVVVLPDTQYYASNFPDIFDAQAEWIVQDQLKGNIAFVLGEGDIVDSDAPEQWTRAAHSLHMLDGVVPYVVAAGNHDYAGGGWVSDRSTMIDGYFPPSTFTAYPWFKGTFEPNRIENNYTLFAVPQGETWLILSLEFGPRDDVIAWANTILKQYPTTPAMIVTHAYLYSDNHRYDNVLYPDQNWSPYDYPIGATPGAVNDGEQMWQKLVRPNSNVRFVLCGHVLNDGIGLLTSTRDDGTTVHQILANYQNYMGGDTFMGGDGYLRVMQFFPADHVVHVRTYSPYYDTFISDTDNDFVLQY